MHREPTQEESPMQWRGRRQSGNVVDRRGMGAIGALGGGGSLILAVLYFLFSGDPGALLQQDMAYTDQTANTASPVTDEQSEFVSVVLADTEDVWNSQFESLRRRYK